MGYGIAAATEWPTWPVWGQASGQGVQRFALVLRVTNPEYLPGGAGSALSRQIRDQLRSRLVAELGLSLHSSCDDGDEICGLVADPGPQAGRGLLLRLRAICSERIYLPGVSLYPMVQGVIVADPFGCHESTALYAHGRVVLDGSSPHTLSSHIRLVDMEGQEGRAYPVLAGDDQISLQFQPQICCTTGSVLALKVLPRIHLVREVGQGRNLTGILPRLDDNRQLRITTALLREACASLRGWDRMGRYVPCLSLALPDRILASPSVVEVILAQLERHDLSPHRLEIEVIEPVGKGATQAVVAANLQELRRAGCQLGLGEFGTGMTRPDNLRHHGFHRVRVGRSFVAGCDHRGDQQRTLLAITALARHLGLQVIADGVSTRDERSFLSQIGVDGVQGPAVFLPLSAEEVDDLLLHRGFAACFSPKVWGRA